MNKNSHIRSAIKIILFVGIWGLLINSLKEGHAENNTTTMRTQKGLHFAVPEDWPIETRGGVTAPIPVEEYVTLKFKEYDDQLDSLIEELGNKFKEIKSVLEFMKGEMSSKNKEINTHMESTDKDVKYLNDDLIYLKQMESRLDSFDKNASDKINALKASISEMEEKRLTRIQYHLRVLDDKLGSLEGRVETMEEER